MAIADFTGKKVLICYIAKSIKELGNPNRKTLLDCVCKYWDIPDLTEANNADFVIGVDENKTIVIVARPDKNGWQKVCNIPGIKDEEAAKKYLTRYAFIGTDISNEPEYKKYIGQTLSSNIKFPQGVTFPLYIENNQEQSWNN